MAKYERIASDLRRSIMAGRLQPGDQLAGEQVLRTTYKVSLPVVRQALDVLESEGLVDRIHGRGTYVRVPCRRFRRTPDRYQCEKNRVRLPAPHRRGTSDVGCQDGSMISDLDLRAEFHTVPANEDLAATFGLPVGADLLQRIYRTRSKQEDVPISLAYSYLVYAAAVENPALLDEAREPWPGGTQHQLYTIGIELDRVVDQITARPPGPEEVAELDLRPGVPVVVLRKTSIDINDRVVEVSDIISPADRIELVYTTKLSRWPSLMSAPS
jgi:GntR family transcriptional regulator